MITTFNLLQQAAPETSPRSITSLKGKVLIVNMWDIPVDPSMTARAGHVPWEEIPSTTRMKSVTSRNVWMMI